MFATKGGATVWGVDDGSAALAAGAENRGAVPAIVTKVVDADAMGGNTACETGTGFVAGSVPDLASDLSINFEVGFESSFALDLAVPFAATRVAVVEPSFAVTPQPTEVFRDPAGSRLDKEVASCAPKLEDADGDEASLAELGAGAAAGMRVASTRIGVLPIHCTRCANTAQSDPD